MNKINIPSYIKKIIKLYPLLTSGRNRYLSHHKRILKNIEIVEKFKKNKDSK
jgi:hypothetical protein